MGDYIAGETGDDGRDTIVGKGNRQSAKDTRAGNDYIQRDRIDDNRGNQVHVELGAVDVVGQQRDRIEEQLLRVASDVQRLTRALIGDQRYGSTGLVQQVEKMDRWRVFSVWALVVIAVSQLIQAWWFYALYSGLSQKILDISRELIEISHKITQ